MAHLREILEDNKILIALPVDINIVGLKRALGCLNLPDLDILIINYGQSA